MNTPAAPHSTTRTIMLILLPVLGILLAIGIALLVRKPKDNANVAVIVTEGQSGVDVNTGAIIDATVTDQPILARVGYRYKVFVDDESDDRSSGIAKIGGKATFIPGARRGQTAIVDVTRVRERVVDANIVKVLSEVALPPKPPRATYVPLPGDSAANLVPGAEMDVIISENSERNPTSEGVAKVNGLVVFVNGAITVGERVNVRITDRRERMAFAELTGKPAGTEPLPESTAPARREAFVPPPGDSAANVVPGAEMDVIIAEASAKNPTTEGVAKVNGLVVFVNGATTIGERVNVRITDRRERMAFAELTGKPAGTEPLPVAAAPARREAFVPPPGDPVVVGAEMDVMISEASEKNPTTEGVARIGGLVVFVNGVTTIGERVNVRITDRRERVAFAMPTGKPAGTEPLPVTTVPARRAAFVPPPGDSAANVVPGAEMDVIIAEASAKNPTTEGVAKVNGLVVFVNGATTIGERVNVRITDRRERMAFAELTGKPAGTEPLPVAEAPVRAPRPYVPAADDATAFIVPGAVIATTIAEASEKNPTTEGVARISGLVVFVKGATTIGQPVNVRITERRRSVAVGEVTTDPVTAAPAAPVTTAPAAAPVVETPAAATPAAAPETLVSAPAPLPAVAPDAVPAASAPLDTPVTPAPETAPAAPAAAAPAP